MALTPGTRVGSYEVVVQIGAGGMGEVYRAHDTKLHRDVALKILPDAFTLDSDRIARFRHEAQVLASLNHANIGAIHGFEDSGSTHALVLELVEGPTLADRIAKGPIPFEEALPIATQIAEALEAAHEQGIIHRDLKPGNVKVRADGVVKVLDFGLAKALAPAGVSEIPADIANTPTLTSPVMTQMGVILGTAPYMSPEQVRGTPVDKRTDIWAFGCVFYEMLSGKRAFSAEGVLGTLAEVMKSEPNWKALPPLPPLVTMFLHQCLKKDPRDRTHDIGDVRLALQGAFEAQGPVAVAGVPARRSVWPLVSIALAAVVVGSLFALWRGPSPLPAAVVRFVDALPENQTFRGTGTVMALSPDGSHVVYNTNRGLVLRSMGELEARLIPGTEGNDLIQPFFSPDGRSIAYHNQQGRMKRIPITGGAPVDICTTAEGYQSSWAADDTILFPQADGIWRVASTSGAPTLVIKAQPGESMDSPSLLPDGQTVLFTVTTGQGPPRWDAADVVAVSLKSGSRKTLVHGASSARYTSSGHLLYAIGTSLYAAHLDLNRLEVGPSVSVLQGLSLGANPGGLGKNASFAISTTGSLIYATGGIINRQLVWVDRKGSETPVGASDDTYQQPRISPDGNRLAVSARSTIWVWTFASGNRSPVSSGTARQFNPAWIDSQRIIFDSTEGALPAGTSIQILRRSADGTGGVDVVADAPAGYPDVVAPDGRSFIYHTPARVLMVRPMSGHGAARPLLTESGLNSDAEISPDGHWVAYESNQSGQFEIYVRSFPDVDQLRKIVSSNGGQHPLWSRDGRELFYIGPSGKLTSVAVGPGPTFSSVHELFPASQYYVNVARCYDYDNKHDRFLFVKMGQPRVTVVLNWFEELKQRVPVK